MLLTISPRKRFLSASKFAVFILSILSLNFAYSQDADGISTDQAVIDAGKTLFENNCKSCHAPSDEVVVGPGLKEVYKRRKIDWIKKWVRNSTALVQSGDPQANEVFNKFNKVQMQSFDFKDEEILSILAYIKAEGSKAPVAAAAPAAGDVNAAAAQPADNGNFNLVLGIFLGILILLLLILVLVSSALTKILNQKADLTESEKELVNTKHDFIAVLKSKAFKTGAVFVVVLFIGKSCIDGLVGIGISQGYAPVQPINFSHKLHAGKYKIDCGYCHTGAYKAKSANIPSSNICMNCHNSIRQESPEIQKIYKAAQSGRPVEWVRVHNLPDLAYFNHSQHTQVGGIKCQQCHGPVEEMEVVQQYSPLTMGWCINCHRETAVNGKDNAYYDKLMAAHQKQSKEPMKVKDIGGLECSKCHY